MSYVPVLNNGGCPCRSGSGLSDGDPVQAIMVALTHDMKQLAMEQAAINTAISITLSFIPIIGWAVGIVFAVASPLIGHYYQSQAKQVIAAFQRDLQMLAASYQQRIQEAQDAAFEQEKQAGVELALSGQVTPDTPSGVSGFKDFMMKVVHVLQNPMRQIHPILRAEHLVFQNVNDVIARCPIPVVASLARELNKQDSKLYDDSLRAQAAIDNAVAQGTGEAGLQKAQEAVTKARAAAIGEFEAQTATAIDNINSPPFRQQLRVEIAKQVLSDPSVAGLVAQKLSLSRQSANAIVGVNATGYTAPSAKLTVLPAVGAAAVVLIGLGLSHK